MLNIKKKIKLYKYLLFYFKEYSRELERKKSEIEQKEEKSKN
jgi:hypothetical protein